MWGVVHRGPGFPTAKCLAPAAGLSPWAGPIHQHEDGHHDEHAEHEVPVEELPHHPKREDEASPRSEPEQHKGVEEAHPGCANRSTALQTGG